MHYKSTYKSTSLYVNFVKWLCWSDFPTKEEKRNNFQESQKANEKCVGYLHIAEDK